jgi:hypothetical protein
MSIGAPQPPLCTAGRVRRGFIRVGALLGLAAGIGLFVYELVHTSEYLDRLDRAERQAICLGPYMRELKFKYPSTFEPMILDAAKLGCPGPLTRPTAGSTDKALDFLESKRTEVTSLRPYIWTLAILAFGATWAAVSAVGWAISGFFRD